MLSCNGRAPIQPPPWRHPHYKSTDNPTQTKLTHWGKGLKEDKSSTQTQQEITLWGVVRLRASHIHRSLQWFFLPGLHPLWHWTCETLTWGFKRWALSITVDLRLWGTSAVRARLIFFFFPASTPCTSLFAPERVIIAAQAVSVHPSLLYLLHTRSVGSLILVITVQAVKHPLNIITRCSFLVWSVQRALKRKTGRKGERQMRGMDG